MGTTPSTRSKRHSLNIYPTSGPRPLQLVNGITSPTNPTPAPATSTRSHVQDKNYRSISPSQTTPRTPRTASSINARRHSSISYKSSSYDDDIIANSENYVPPTRFQTKSRPRSLMFLTRSSHPGYPHSPVTASSPLARDDNNDRGNPDPRMNVMSASGTSAGPPTEENERQPLTLVEKHADLLRFIAQKESKCLELRSQLAMHEAELVQLKRKWERIVSRSFDSPLSPSPSISSSLSLPSDSTAAVPTGTVFEGIKESVQGVSRLIASGLSVSCDPPYYNLASPLALHSPSRTSTTQSRPRPKPRPHSLYSQNPSITTPSHSRTANLSASSNATSSTSSGDSVTTPATAPIGRFSETSFNSSPSFFEEDELFTMAPPTNTKETRSFLTTGDVNDAEDAKLTTNSSIDSWPSSELIVRDTGATPVMSPNPRFKFAAERRQRESEKTGFSKTNDKNQSGELETDINEDVVVTVECKDDNNETLCPGMGNSSAIRRSNSNSRCHRRKSRDVSGLVPSSSSFALDGSPNSHSPDLNSNNTPLISEPSQQGSRSSPSPTFISSPATELTSNSLLGALAPVSIIPGLSLTESAGMLITGACKSNSEGSSPSHPMEMENEAVRASAYQLPQTQQRPSSSWMGKKWDTWTQKRASGLFSDVSQTLACAFSLSATTNATAPPPPAPRSASSILDQDDATITMMGEPMKPTTVSINPKAIDNRDMCYQSLRSKVQNDDEPEWDW